jgi:hypothetical protein
LFNLEKPFFLIATPKAYATTNFLILANFYQIMKNNFQDGKHLVLFWVLKKNLNNQTVSFLSYPSFLTT